MISLEPHHCPTRAAVFLHFANWEEQLRLHKEDPWGTAVIVAEAGICRTRVTSGASTSASTSVPGRHQGPSEQTCSWPSTPRMLPASACGWGGGSTWAWVGGEGVLAGR